MSTAAHTFYVAGGTLSPDAPCYVDRSADRELYDGLNRGEFCYVLTARQMGKSSLMMRTRARLLAGGAAVAVLDLSVLGLNLTAEQWYYGLLGQLGQQLDLRDVLRQFWLEHTLLGPLQRWVAALREVVLPHCPGRLVLFIDEIDTVRGLPFSTDEFFAAIRECYNRRAQDEEFHRLTFCFLGVATPSDLIQDTRTTPFNIGRRVELHDFTEAEAAPLRLGLALGELESRGRADREARALLSRVLYWTGGHAYLTQRLCQAVAQDATVTSPTGVDRLCRELFLSHGAREKDDNLLFVRDRLLRSDADPAALLDLYAQVRAGKRVHDEEQNPLVTLLRLSGIVRVVAGCLKVRNRIYGQVFDRDWIRANMPDAELRRQQVAYRRGLVRSVVLSAFILGIVGSLLLAVMTHARRAEERERLARRSRYVAEMLLAQQVFEERNFEYLTDLLENLRPAPGQEDLRGFEWRHLWQRIHNDLITLATQDHDVRFTRFLPGGGKLAACTSSNTIKVWDVITGQPLLSFPLRSDYRTCSTISPDGQMLAGASAFFPPREASSRENPWLRTRWEVRVWDRRANQYFDFRGRGGQIYCMEVSPDGRLLAAGTAYPKLPQVAGEVKLWDLSTRRLIASLRGHRSSIFSLAFAPASDFLATGSADGSVRIWSMRTKRSVRVLEGHRDRVSCLAYSPDGRTLAAGSSAAWSRPQIPGEVRLWDIARKVPTAILRGHDSAVFTAAFSPDGKTLATGGRDSVVKLWNLSTRREAASIVGHTGPIRSLSFSPDGRRLATAGSDQTVKVWPITIRPVFAAVRVQSAPLDSLAFSPDSRILAVRSTDGTIKLWNSTTMNAVGTLRVQGRGPIGFTPDSGRLLAGDNGSVRVWNVSAHQEDESLKPPRPSASQAFSPNSTTIAIGCDDGSVLLWNYVTKQATTLIGHKGAVRSIVFSPVGATIATVGIDDTVRLWDPARGSERGHLKTSGFVALCFCPRGRMLALGTDRTVRLWDTEANVVNVLGEHSRQIKSLAFCPDGKTLATSGLDGEVKLWQVNTGQPLGSLAAFVAGNRALLFAPDGRMLVAGGEDGTLYMWRAPSLTEVDSRRRLLVKRAAS